MKITIPPEHQSRFTDGKVFVGRWKNGDLLLLTTEESERVITALNSTSGLENGLVRFVEAGIVEVDLVGDYLTIPPGFEGSLHEAGVSIHSHPYGLLISNRE